MRYSFPLAFMANSFAMTVLLIVLGLIGKSYMAAEVGIVQAATLALLYAFSANARSLILGKSGTVSAYSVAIWRLFLLMPLAILSYWLSVNAAGVEALLAIILIARRCIDWLSEIHLSEMERLGHQDIARRYVLLQSALMLLVLVWLVGNFPFPLLGLGVWAFFPLFFSLGFIGKSIAVASDAIQGGILSKVLPHFGSTAIIGITVYVFRLLILLITGKETAGDLYTAFAIGGLTGSVFANALGASIVLHEERSGTRYFPSLLRHALNLSLLIGICIFIVVKMQILNLEWTGKSSFFWEAAGLSMIGGVIMVYAQRVRFRLLQTDEEHDVFGPDVLMNILLIASVPFVFYLLGVEALSFLYLFSSLLAYVFYISARKEKKKNQVIEKVVLRKGRMLRVLLAMLLLLPVFFQLNHGIFNDPSIQYKSGGVLRELPIPVSVLACYGGILLLGVYRRAFVSFGFIFLTCVLMVMSTVILSQGDAIEQQAKFILLIQFILPMAALVTGQVYEPLGRTLDDNSCAQSFLWVLILIVPVQMYFTWKINEGHLAPTVGLFSIYQYLQYVPVIFVSAYLFALTSLWQGTRQKIFFFVFTAIMALYTAASVSMLAIALLFIGLSIHAFLRFHLKSEKLPVALLFLSAILVLGYLNQYADKVAFKFSFLAKHSQLKEIPDDLAYQKILAPNEVTNNEKNKTATLNITQRFQYWEYYVAGVTTNSKAFFLGASNPPDRSKYPSAHNYYLDFIYNFGLLALIPLLFLIGGTVLKVFRLRKTIIQFPSTLALCIIVFFLLLVDNFMKVGLRQPYSGIFTFFLFGILITRLSEVQCKKHASV